jgi:hypothetical protein
MTLPSSGTISISQIATEFGDDGTHSLSEYYRGGSYVTANNTNVPTSGAIALSDFYGAVNELSVTASNASSVNLQTLFNNASAGSWTSTVPKRYTIGSSVVLGITTVPASMGGTLIIDNSGDIQGVGGSGNGGAAGTAMTVQSTGVTINMLSGSTISGGGGGGGQGGTGGQGLTNECIQQHLCPPANITGSCEQDEKYLCNIYHSGGSGGSGGQGQGYGQSAANGSSGASGGTNAGAGGTGGNGGSFAVAGATGATGANGNYSNGASGSGGGAAGRAITFSGVSAYTIIGTDSGTINGAYT